MPFIIYTLINLDSISLYLLLANLIIWSSKSDSAPVSGEAYEPASLRT